MDVTRLGRARLGRLALPRGGEGSRPRTIVQVVLQSPWTRVEDTDIRGYLDGRVKYNFNQGTAYHMRVGRRYNGASRGEYELKRSLVRWDLGQVPRRARIVDARARLWLEAPEVRSPAIRYLEGPGLHLYAYPVSTPWFEGTGGVGKDSFSDAAPGEVSWNEARTGDLRWPCPGGLPADAEPLGAATIRNEEGWIEIRGARLAPWLQARLEAGESADLLLKLDDMEEDLWGTEVALLTSNFGDDHDLPSKRPALVLDVEIEGDPVEQEVELVLETGEATDADVIRHPGETVFLWAEAPGLSNDVFPPAFWVRGGLGEEDTAATWEPLHIPMIRRWDWSQFRIGSVARRLPWGEPFGWSIEATWIQPGPREAQLPELLLVAPSGDVRRAEVHAAARLRYEVELIPDEPGLWRYVWSFRPMSVSAPMAHNGRGLFWVDLVGEDAAVEDLRAIARQIVTRVSGHPKQTAGDVLLVDTFVREAARLARTRPDVGTDLDAAMEEVREALPAAKLGDAVKNRFE